MVLTKEDIEYIIIKHFITYPEAVVKAQNMRIDTTHFTHKPEDAKQSYTRILVNLIFTYFKQSDGKLFTKNLLDQKMIENNANKKFIRNMELVWSTIQEQECDKNELHGFLESLKTKKCLAIWDDCLENSLDKLNDGGLKEGINYLQSCISEMNQEMIMYEEPPQNAEMNAVAEEFKAEYLRRKNDPEQFRGIKCGLDEIDRRTFGFFPSQLVAFIGPSGGGKSTQLLHVAQQAHAQGKNVLYFSFELDIWSCILRHVSNKYRIPMSAMRNYALDESDLDDLVLLIQENKTSAYFYYDANTEDPTPEYIEAKIREVTATHGKPDVVVVDYLGNMSLRNNKGFKEHEQQAEILKALFQLAKRMNILVYMAQQLNRQVLMENRRNKAAGKAVEMRQDAAAGSQKLIHYASYIIGLEPHKDEQENMVTYHPVKTREFWFPPFGAKINPELNQVIELSEEEQHEWRVNQGVIDPESYTNGPTKFTTTETNEGNKTLNWGDSQETYEEEDLEISLDAWEAIS